ncbi:nuclear transport factor 2 family protein (plasmid) [Rhizobium sullae]|uniref:Nuclear transport factor 2 family protein n=1 Tax=Rhizobium sullae TaxID=50338 RepID=A0ABY5XXY6_RHISU|nr:nuclear transport factor 2 family protein [Rhizobium sullae]UWU19500.1 nuclear transport factor 2 family protein [Rhizobium sullae]
MKKTLTAVLICAAMSIPAFAQTAVVAVPDAEVLFTSPDPKLHANKQVAYNIIKVLLEANQWDRAHEFIADDYVQHNPNVRDGLQAVVYFFTEVVKAEPSPVPEKMSWPVVEVMAEADLVTVIYPRKGKTADGKEYTTAWFDTWRIKDGRAVEHWDPALINEAPNIAR